MLEIYAYRIKAYNNENKKKFIIKLLIIVCACCLFLDACRNRDFPEKKLQIINGELDLSSWDFEKDGPLPLKGMWKFRWLAPGPDFNEADPGAALWQDYPVPGYWNRITGSKYGYGWFRLIIRNAGKSELGISLYTAHTAYELYVNNKLVLHNGYPGSTRRDTIPERMPVDALLPGGETLILAWKISNFHDLFGGPGNCPVIGKPGDLRTAAWKQRAADAFMLGVIAIMCFYHMHLWMIRWKDKASFYFAMICLVIIIRTIIIDYHLIDIFPFLALHEMHTKLDLLSLPFTWFFLNAFLKQLFPGEFMKIPDIVFAAAALLFGLIVLFTPSWIYLEFLIPYYVVIMFAGCWLLFVLIRAVIRKRQSAVIILAAACFFALVSVNDILYSWFPHLTRPLLQTGLLFFIIAQSIVLAIRFSLAYRTADHLSHNLRREVGIKTATISRQNLELVRLNKEKTLFFINLAHELKTPLTLINNYLDKYIGAKGSNADALIIQENFQKLKNDIINFLDYEKITRGEVFYGEAEVIDLACYMEKKIALFKEAARLKEMVITAEIEKELYIKMDPAALDRVVNNLLDNAVKYTDKGGQIHIALAGGDSGVKLVIRDNGIGIPPEEQARIFEPYFRASRGKSNHQGMGIGLSLVKKIMDEAGGKINLCSRESHGTMIMLQFQRYRPGSNDVITREYAGNAPAVPGHAPQIAEAPYDKNKKNILVVEDNDAMLSFLQNNLQKLYNVFYARDGREALNKLDTIPVPDLILSDIMMDGMDGLAFQHAAAQSEKYKFIPFIFLSAKTAADDRLAGLNSGAVDFIGKPFDMRELQARIKSLLKMQDEQRSQNIAEMEQKILQVIHAPAAAGSSFGEFEEKCALYQLSLREKEVLRLIFQGSENKEIARALNISYPTVRTHIRHIFDKCKAANKVELLKIFKKF